MVVVLGVWGVRETQYRKHVNSLPNGPGLTSADLRLPITAL